MSWQEKLTKAYAKAWDGGWRPAGYVQAPIAYEGADPSGFIFDRGFANALWGEDEWKACKVCHREHYDQTDSNDNMPPSEYHLMEMVIADERIRYLGEHS